MRTMIRRRSTGKRGMPKPAFLIVCGGEKTEPNYFNNFPIKSVWVDVAIKAEDPMSLVKYAIELKKDYKTNGMKFEQVWCVFDKDDFPLGEFNNAVKLAQEKKLKVAYSNESFELWYLLHFDYMHSAIGRSAYIEKLKQKPGMGGIYRKNDNNMYQKLLDRQSTAIQHAEKLILLYSPVNPGKDSPSTTVHCLVQELNKFITNGA